MPGIVPKDNSGSPNLAESLAIIISQIIDNSKPPPKAYPFTHAIIGFLLLMI